MKIGDLIDERYKVISVLGEGGMAIVYLAKDLISKKEVAIKIIREETMKKPVSITRFEREEGAAASLNHPNIVRVINLGTFEGRPYMVNELIHGQTLKDVLNVRGKYSISEALDIMSQLCGAIYHANQHNVIHRDIKPQNLYITQDGTVKLGDFGIATFSNAPSRVTRSNVVVGSVHYLAPEISQGKPASPQSDIYAMGITFFELLTGRVPFDDESPVYVALKHIKDKMPSIRKINNKIPVQIEKIINKACAKNPDDRYKSADEMKKEIDRLIKNPELMKKVSLFQKIFGRKNKD